MQVLFAILFTFVLISLFLLGVLAFTAKHGTARLTLSCASALLAFAFLAAGSTIVGQPQPGHITAGNAVLAVMMGPWSEILPPNAQAVSTWPEPGAKIALLLTLAIVATMTWSIFVKKIALRYASRIMMGTLLIVWAGYGLVKVLRELS